MKFDTDKIRYLLNEIDNLNSKLNEGIHAWDDGKDQFAMAECDPGIQYEISNKIEELWYEIYDDIYSNVIRG